MPGRLHSPRDPVAFTLDGERLVGERGEPLAAALVGAGKWTLARSPKFHRPRGPSCMRGACDGCLARVDGVANVMTCMVAADAGMEVTSQNTLGSREIDLLQMTDWFFPDGMNHHELFAGVPGVQAAMQLFARRVAGLGLLPDADRALERAASSAGRASRRAVEVLVVGAGPAGMAVATAAAARGFAVEVVDDGLQRGGSTRGFLEEDEPELTAIVGLFDRAVAAGTVRMRSRTVAAAVFGRDVLVVGPAPEAAGEGPGGSRVEILEPRALVIAAGAHDGVVPFENNDLAGVVSARAACLLASTGVAVGERVVLLDRPSGTVGEASFANALERALTRGGSSTRRVAAITRVSEVVRVTGGASVRSVVVREGGALRTLRADALVVDAPRAPAYELCEQAGGRLEHRPDGYAPVTHDGQVADRVWAVGEVTGAPLVASAIVAAADAVVRQFTAPA